MLNGAVRVFGFALLLSTVLLTGCEGDDGGDGAVGPTGPAGPSGPPGPSVPVGGIPISAAKQIEVDVTAVIVPAGGGAPVVDVRLANDLGQGLTGLPADNIRFLIAQLTPGNNGESNAWQSYITGDDNGVANVQATAEPASAGVWIDNGDGTYRYTFAQALVDYASGPVFDASKTHRVGLEIRTNTGGFLPENVPANNAPFDFVPSGGAPMFTHLVVDNDTCNACHDNLELHGEARFDVGYCVQCHNPFSVDANTGNSVDMKVMTHKIHQGAALANGYQIIGFGDRLHDYSNIQFSQDIRNCAVCHDESDVNTPQASNWREVANRASCGTCHDEIDWASASNGHPGGLVFTDDSQCLDCHGPTATINDGAVQTAKAHEIPSELASAAFFFNVLNITNSSVGEFPEVTFSVTDPTDNDTPYDLATASEFTACASGTSRLAVDVGWTTDDFTNLGSGSDPAQPVSINVLIGTGCGGTAIDNMNGTYTAISPVAVPMGLTGTLSAALEGHPWEDLDADGIPGFNERIGVTNTIAYASIDGSDVVQRRNSVAIEKCNDCHNRLSVHGNNRTDELSVCAMCHNPNATDDRQRNAGACVNQLGTDDVAIDFKYMVHAIHAGQSTDYAVCGFGNSVHRYNDLTYPGRLNNCEGCHQPDTYYPVEPGELLGMTVSVGSSPLPNDDTVVSPNTAACYGCHVDTVAVEHMKQNGGDFTATKDADSALVSLETETCTLCHGPGRTVDVKAAHGVGRFRFN